MLGGSEIAIDEITKRLPDISFEIMTPRFRSDLLKRESKDNVFIHRIGLGTISDKYLFPLSGFLAGLAAIRRARPYCIHAFQASYGGLAGAFIKSVAPTRIRFLVTLQEGKDLAGQFIGIRLMRRYVLRHADAIVAISSYLADYARAINPNARVVVIPNGIDPDQFSFDGTTDSRTVITVSRLVPKNGVEYLIRAMEFIVDPAIRLLIVGSGPEGERLKTLVQDKKLSKRVDFYGDAEPEKIPKLLSGAGVFVRPSLSEGLGTAFLEAMAAKVSVIGTPVGGIPDFLEDGETGLFVRVADPHDIAMKIERIFSNPELRERLIERAYRMVVERYTWKQIAGQYHQLYAQ